MKKLIALILSALLFCGIVTPAFTADAEPDKSELIAAEIVSIPEKNKFVFTGGAPEYPDGIVLKLSYSDGTVLTETIEEKNGEYYAGTEKVNYIGKSSDEVVYGLQTANLEMKEGEIKLSYKFYSEKPEPEDFYHQFMTKIAIWLESASISWYLFHEKVINFFAHLFQSVFTF